MAPPRVTVFIPMYNRAAHIGSAIESVLAQSFADLELLVVDDGSTDDGAAVVESYGDPRIRFERSGSNLGIPVTRQRGLELARGEYLAMLDSDDLMRPLRLERQVRFLDRHQAIASVGGWLRKTGGAAGTDKTVARPLAPAEVQAWLLFKNAHANTTLMGRTAVMKRFGYRPEFSMSEDYDLAARMALQHPPANLHHVLTDMRMHGGQITRTSFDSKQGFKLTIMREQIAALGIAANDLDLRRHYALGRVSREDVRADPDLPRWAHCWVRRFIEANAKARVYQPRALQAVLGLVVGRLLLKSGDGARRRLLPLLRDLAPLSVAACAGHNLGLVLARQ